MNQLITANQLCNLNAQHLSDLFLLTSRKLATTEAGTLDRAKALGSLENISYAMAARCR